MRADIIVLKPDKIRAIGLLEDPYTTVVYNLSEESISDVYIDGKKDSIKWEIHRHGPAQTL